jgi:sugar O-acyltransferase (sialic acid O-acetyltransferase NeuD family)
MMTDLIIVGTGGHAREVLDVIEAINGTGDRYRVIGFLDDDPTRHGQSLRGHPVLGGLDWLAGRSAVQVTIGVGSSRARGQIRQRLGAWAPRSPALVHPRASLTPHVQLSDGCIIAAGTVVTSSVRLGAHVHLNVGVTLSHDCVIGDSATLAPGAHVAGNVTLGEGCEVGMGAVIIQGRALGAWSVIGAGSVVTKDVPANTTAVGIPARVIRHREPDPGS